MKKLIRKNWTIFFALSLTLGLAPFNPEPHLIGKTRWIIGGAKGMEVLDWMDFFFHISPWVMFIYSIVLNLSFRKSLEHNEN